MREKLAIAKKELESVIQTDRESFTDDKPAPDSSQVDSSLHRPSTSPRRRFRQSGRSNFSTSTTENVQQEKRNCRAIRKAATSRQVHSEKQSRPAVSASTISQPMTLVERLEAMTRGIRIAELAVLLGTGRTTLYDWVDAGTIPAYRHRGVIFFDPVVVAAWLRRQATLVRAQVA